MKDHNDMIEMDKDAAPQALRVEIDCITPPTEEQLE